LVLAPVLAKQFMEMFEEVLKSAPPGQGAPGPAQIAQMGTSMGYMLTGTAVGMVVLGGIYPVIVLIVLTRPSAKAACAGGMPEPGDEFWSGD